MSPARVLIVEDDKPVRESLTAYLEDCGLQAHGASNAEEALGLLERSGADAVIADLRLPKTSGEELIRRIHARWPRIVFLIFTGSVRYRIPEDLANLPCLSERIFFKPLEDLNELAEELKRLLQMRRNEHGKDDHYPDHR